MNQPTINSNVLWSTVIGISGVSGELLFEDDGFRVLFLEVLQSKIGFAAAVEALTSYIQDNY